MPVNTNQGIVFIHIPKTAGTSIEAALGMLGDWREEDLEICFGHIQSRTLLEKGFSSNYLQHLTLEELSILLSARIDEMAIFTVVRNPWDRFLSSFRRKDPDLASLYNYKTRGDIHALDIESYLDLAEWLDHPHLRPQYQFLIDYKTSVISDRVKIFHQEGLDELVRWLGLRLGERLTLPVLNVNVNESAVPVLSNQKIKKLKQRVYEIYRCDYDAFGYEFAHAKVC